MLTGTTHGRAAVTHAGAPWEILPVSFAAPGDQEVLVRLKACGVCHTDAVVREMSDSPVVRDLAMVVLARAAPVRAEGHGDWSRSHGSDAHSDR